jgi:hypothetical protein
MQPQNGLKKIQLFFKDILSKYAINRVYILLCILLLVVFLISFVIPILHFGRFFGTDDYSHLFHTQVMTSSKGMSDFYQNMGAYVSDPSGGNNDYNYPFGLWLFGATISKITGIPPVNAELYFVILFLAIILASFYCYSSIFLESKEERILAVLFLVSMPSAAIDLLSFRPSIFILPFLFILMYIVLKEPVRWKLFPLVWLAIFIIIISHTGTFIFLFLFSLLFFFLYCLLWGKFSMSMYVLVLSTTLIYIFSLNWFPEIAYQYNLKTKLLLLPGNFLDTKINFSLPAELANIFYQNMIVNVEVAYIIIFGALIFTIGSCLLYLHRIVSEKLTRSEQMFPISLPITNMSKTVAAAPFWIGPIHVILTFLGIFKLDNRGKCLLISALLITLVPDMLTSQSTTGITREVSFLVLIIPITTALGLGILVSYLNSSKIPRKNIISTFVWIIVLVGVIIPPILATTYYLPTVAGEDYVINGMKWLGNTGDLREKVVGYGYRPVPIYTNMTDAAYGVQLGNEETKFRKLLTGIYSSQDVNNVEDLQQDFGVRYILKSDKLIKLLNISANDTKIDDNIKLDKIYSSKDFGVYDAGSFSEKTYEQIFMADNISFQRIGSSFQIETDVYKVVMNGNFPIMEQFGPPHDNYFGRGSINDDIFISGLRESHINPFLPPNESAALQNSSVDEFLLDRLPVSPEINGNQITYRTILKDTQNGTSEATLLVRYTFYPKTVKKELLLSNDWVTLPVERNMNVNLYTVLDVPLNDFVIKSDNRDPIKRYMYPSLDTVSKSVIIQNLYIFNGERGIYIRNEPTTSYPTSVDYRGSTLYNMSILVTTQIANLKPGETLHVTQFLSPGDEITAEKNIQTQQGIHLLNYPNGMSPIMLLGYHTPYTDSGPNNTAEQGYQVIRDENITYSEVVIPELKEEIPEYEQNITPSDFEGSLNIEESASNIPEIDLQAIANKDIKIIGSGSTGSKLFNNFSTQERSISSLIDYIKSKDVAMIGYMPGSMNYNLDTLNIISEKNISFMISDTFNPPYYGYFGLINKNPRLATYQGESKNIALLSVSNPMSTALSPLQDNTETFSAWKATIDEANSSDGMILFIIRAEDIGNPDFTEDFTALIEYAKNNGLTFTTPDKIVQHYNDIQNIQYSGSLDGDKATINLTNNNDHPVQGVAFRIVLPYLKKGSYNVSAGTLVKTKSEKEHVIIYASTDIPERTSKEITIQPDLPRDKIVVTMPRQLIEGQIRISLTDIAGKPLQDADVIIDSKYYQPDADGYVNVNLKRGVHQLTIQCPGFETQSLTLNVNGRLYVIEQLFKK